MMTRKQVFNIYTTTVFLISSLTPILCCALSSRILIYLVNGTKLGDTLMVNFVLGWGFSSYMINVFTILQFLLPILPAFGAGYFFALNDGFFTNAQPRCKNYSRYIWRRILISAFTCTLFIFLGFIVFMSFGLLTHPVEIDDNWTRSLFGEFFGNSFSYEHPVGYFLLEGILKYILFPFTYSLLAIALSFYVTKKYLCVLIPTGYYIIFSIFAIFLKSNLFNGSLYTSPVFCIINPSATLMSGAEFENVMLYKALLPLLIPLIFSVTAILYKLKKRS